MRRVPAMLLVLVAIAVFAFAGYVLVHNPKVKDTGGGPDLTVSSAAAPSTSGVASTPSASRPPGDPVVAFLGDDWTAGVGATSNSKRFTTVLSKELSLRERNFGVNGSGYAAASSSNRNYGARVARVVAAHPQVVVLSGGRNDVVQDEAGTAATKAGTLFADLHAKLPDARLVAIAPMWGDSAPPDELATLAKAIKAAVTRNGGTYLDISDPVQGHPSYMAGDADPGDSGYAAIARALRDPLGRIVNG